MQEPKLEQTQKLELKRLADNAYFRKYLREHPEYRERRKAYLKEWYQNHKDYLYEHNKQWRSEHPKTVIEATKRYRHRHPEKISEQRRRYRLKNPQKKKARARARYLKKDEQCKNCGSKENLVTHHPDYDKPLLIVTLCHQCHVHLHKKKVR